ncbi:hypothetical protein [Acidovorax sp. sic0104]|uniref:hypothetical protein n=1 Tax=Acidovorax sp. sic0104 TaxID=2854784 RepID=UPI001C4812C8|nr:hypothetical protein [Acidovorax sp. sic0104]MBV7541995.1 hypothetical protein [Acidovorax sp. sic0104]
MDLSGNDGTYSLETARLLLGASAEVDVVLKLLCKRFDRASKAKTIGAYYPEVTANCPNFVAFEVQLPRYGARHQPWISWTADQPPIWWSDHNKVKHQRDMYFERATLKNCLNAVGALFVAVLHLYEKEAGAGELLQLPRLFNVGDRFFGGTQMGRYGQSFVYKLR